MSENEKVLFLKSIASNKRYAIFQLLAKNKSGLTPSFIAEYFNTTAQTISVHLLRLKRGNAIKEKKIHRNIFYTINSETIKNFKFF